MADVVIVPVDNCAKEVHSKRIKKSVKVGHNVLYYDEGIFYIVLFFISFFLTGDLPMFYILQKLQKLQKKWRINLNIIAV